MTAEHRSERRLVTCLFLDVVGSTDMTVSLGPERMKRALERAFADLDEILRQHGGTIEKYIGDAIFVIFGAPAAHTDDPERALRAAIACSERAARSRAGGGAVDVGIGVRSGARRGLRARFGGGLGGRATFALVSGPPGQGKSRLTEEFLATLPSDIRVLSARCRPGTESGTFTPLRQLVTADVGDPTIEALTAR